MVDFFFCSCFFLQAIEPPSQLTAVRRSTVSSFSIDLTHKRRCNSLHLTGDLFVIFIYFSVKLEAAEALSFLPKGQRESATEGSLRRKCNLFRVFSLLFLLIRSTPNLQWRRGSCVFNANGISFRQITSWRRDADADLRTHQKNEVVLAQNQRVSFIIRLHSHIIAMLDQHSANCTQAHCFDIYCRWFQFKA